MSDKKIVFRVKKGPKVTVQEEAFGFTGGACRKAAEPYERAIGLDVTSIETKPEAYVQADGEQKQKVGE